MTHSSRLFQIQFLRAIAVSLVVAFHTGIPFFSHGYLGVDIFFVISGFLMGLLYPNFNSKSDVIRFWSRRLVRLLPAFIFVNSILFLPLFLQFLPFERKSLLMQYFSSFAFVSNYHFWSQEQYFASESLRPLLHTWSLAIEVQFYFLFPFLAWLSRKSGYFLALIFAFSGIGYVTFAHYSENSVFFLLPFRLWEFIAGFYVSVSYDFMKKMSARISPLPNLFATFIVLAVLSLPISIYTPFDINLFAVLFTVIFIITAKEESVKNGLVFKIVNSIGNRSYVIYLVHFPLLVALTYRPFQGNILRISSFSQGFIYLVLLFLIAEFTHRYVEFFRPTTLKRNWLGLVGITLVISITTAVLSRTPLVHVGINEKSSSISNSQEDRSQFRCGILARIQLLNALALTKDYCLISNGGAKFTALLIGNSHADAVKESVGNSVEHLGGALYLAQENMNLNANNRRNLQDIVKVVGADLVILHSREATYDWISLSLFIDNLRKSNIKLIILGSVPEYTFSVPKMLLETHSTKLSKLDIRYFELRKKEEISFFNQYSNQASIKYVSTLESFCRPLCRIANHSWQPFYFDSNHLTLTGAKELEPVVREEISKLLALHTS